jgi:arylsulfatase A-like enzyme
MQLDDTVGQIDAALKQHHLDENTLVIITSDNGSPGRYGSLEAPNSIIETFDHKPNWILRGLKADTWDGGHRVPCVAKWKNYIPARSTCNKLICLMDLLATCAAILDRDLPTHTAEDSLNIFPYLLGEQPERPIRTELVHQGYHGLYGIRKGNWKLIFGQGSGGLSPDPPTTIYDPPQQLYNIYEDIRERKNLYFQHPEQVECLTKVFIRHKHYPTAPHIRKKRSGNDNI